MKHIFKNIKTTLLGLMAICGGVVSYLTTKDPTTAATAIATGLGLIFARDASTGTDPNQAP